MPTSACLRAGRHRRRRRSSRRGDRSPGGLDDGVLVLGEDLRRSRPVPRCVPWRLRCSRWGSLQWSPRRARCRGRDQAAAISAAIAMLSPVTIFTVIPCSCRGGWYRPRPPAAGRKGAADRGTTRRSPSRRATPRVRMPGAASCLTGSPSWVPPRRRGAQLEHDLGAPGDGEGRSAGGLRLRVVCDRVERRGSGFSGSHRGRRGLRARRSWQGRWRRIASGWQARTAARVTSTGSRPRWHRVAEGEAVLGEGAGLVAEPGRGMPAIS